jgi:hypothetical protein
LDFAEYTSSPRIIGVEVLLKIRLAGARDSGHSTLAAGWSAFNSYFKPLISSRFLGSPDLLAGSWSSSLVMMLANNAASMLARYDGTTASGFLRLKFSLAP